jgi:hypothetical protein
MDNVVLDELKKYTWKTFSLTKQDVKKIYRYLKHRKMIEPEVHFREQIVSFDFHEDMAMITYKDEQLFFKIQILTSDMIKFIPEESEIEYYLVIMCRYEDYTIFLYYKDYMIFRHRLSRCM